MKPNFAEVTEVPGHGVTQAQINRSLTRYLFAAGQSAGKDVLEVACGPGQGLGLLSRQARLVVGLDLNPELIRMATAQYAGRQNITVLEGNAQALPFSNQTFDTVVIFEATYYLADVASFFREVHRVLKPAGLFLTCSANRDWADFNPSPFSVRYFSVPDFHSTLSQCFSDLEFWGSTPAQSGTMAGRVVSLLKRFAVRWHLMPQTMKGKELFKRIFLGVLRPLPSELTPDCGTPDPLIPISCHDQCRDFQVIFSLARKSH